MLENKFWVILPSGLVFSVILVEWTIICDWSRVSILGVKFYLLTKSNTIAINYFTNFFFFLRVKACNSSYSRSSLWMSSLNFFFFGLMWPFYLEKCDIDHPI